jgi:hypothetical protein
MVACGPHVDVSRGRKTAHSTSACDPKGTVMTESSPPDSRDHHTTVDTSLAHPARVYDYWLGGKDNFAADRTVGDIVGGAFPGLVRSARAERAFLRRAVRYLVNEAGVRQFLDVGTGLPTASSTHLVAQALAPESRVVYVDNDPLVLAHARALLTSSPEGATAYVDGDARDTTGILQAAETTLDFGKPVAIILLRILSFIANDDEAYAIVNELVRAVPVGSYLVIAHLARDVDSETLDEAIRLWSRSATVPITPREEDEIARFFDGLELVDPGIVSCSQWRPDPGELPVVKVPEYCAVGRKAREAVIAEESPSGFTPQATGPGGRSDTSDRLAEISRLGSGWLDGEGSEVSQSVINLARVVGEKLAERGLVSPNVYPTIEGGVLFEWSRGSWELSIEIHPDLNLDLVRVNVDTGTIIESTAEEQSLGEAVDAIHGMA